MKRPRQQELLRWRGLKLRRFPSSPGARKPRSYFIVIAPTHYHHDAVHERRHESAAKAEGADSVGHIILPANDGIADHAVDSPDPSIGHDNRRASADGFNLRGHTEYACLRSRAASS